MAYDLEEQEQLATLKAWWKQYGSLLTWVLIAVLAAYAGWTGWNVWQRNQSTQASQLYEELQKAAAARDNSRVQRAATDLQERFSRTAYGQMSALTAARSAYDANDMAVAKSRLQWAIDKGRDEEFQVIARIRLAGVLMDEKKFDDALKLLSVNVDPQFSGAIADRRGDVLAAQNKVEEARTAYKTALEKSDERSPARGLIQLKLDALSAPASKAAG